LGDFAKTINLAELPLGTLKTIDSGGEKVLLANVNGRIFGMGAICNHERCDLAGGILTPEDGTVTCACHAAIWDLRTGKAEFYETLEDEPVYETRIDAAYIFVKKR
jgi:nitrite reductase/ring-hydroxylating ferredoxin subunit